jgi:tartrate-resistant acid phosphatase type 5
VRHLINWDFFSIGNHDCEGSIDAMLEYASGKHSLWYFPQRYYKIDRPVAPKTILRIIVLDACDLVCGHEPRNVRCKDKMNEQSSERTRLEQYTWIESQLSAGMPAGVERMWTIVVGHWAVYSYAGNADTPELIRSLDPLLKKYKVHAYMNGHDHCMQHIKRKDDDGAWTMNYFVSGAGGYRVHDLKPHSRGNPDLIHAAMTHGFMSVRLTRDLFRVQLIDTMGEILYTTDVPYDQ